MPADFCDSQRMDDENVSGVLSANLKALKAAHTELTSDARVAKRAGVDQKTVWRMINESNSATLGSITQVAAAFDLQAWQILVPGLDPRNPPVVTMTAVERAFYSRLKQDLSVLLASDKSDGKPG